MTLKAKKSLHLTCAMSMVDIVKIQSIIYCVHCGVLWILNAKPEYLNWFGHSHKPIISPKEKEKMFKIEYCDWVYFCVSTREIQLTVEFRSMDLFNMKRRNQVENSAVPIYSSYKAHDQCDWNTANQIFRHTQQWQRKKANLGISSTSKHVLNACSWIVMAIVNNKWHGAV